MIDPRICLTSLSREKVSIRAGGGAAESGQDSLTVVRGCAFA